VRPRIGDFPEVDEKGQEKWPKGDEKTWKAALRGITTGELFSLPLYPSTDNSAEPPEISKSIVHHVQTSLARAPYNIDDFGAYQAAALSVRDNLIVSYDLLGYLKITAPMPFSSAHAR
jgi:starch phosphorylase